MSRSQKFSTVTILGVAAIVLVLDQLSKRWVSASLLPDTPYHVIKNILDWKYLQNINGAFGLFGSNPIVLIGLAIVVLVVFAFLFREAAERSLLVRVAFGMIVGGAIGNIADRLQYHYVIDFIAVLGIPFWNYTFNVADACITTGVILLVLSSLVKPRRRRA